MQEKIEKFLASPVFAVAGASVDRHKYGNKVLRCYLQHGKKVIPINPREAQIEGLMAVTSVLNLPEEVKSLSIITPPSVTEIVVGEAVQKGIENIWMQPGAESNRAIEMCRERGINVIADGSCILVVLGYRDH